MISSKFFLKNRFNDIYLFWHISKQNIEALHTSNIFNIILWKKNPKLKKIISISNAIEE